MPIKKDIIYPVFLECCQFTSDAFWENIFEDLSYGKTPYGTYISKNFLCCSYKNKEFSYKIERKNPKDLYQEIYNLLTKKLGILSNKEKIKKRFDFYQTESRIVKNREEWSNIKKKNIKDLLIEKYVLDMKKKHSLTMTQAKYLLSIIFISLVFKVISPKDIIYHDNKIHDIEGIEFVKNKIIFKREIYNTNLTISYDTIADKKILSEKWNKYLEMIRKNFTSDSSSNNTEEIGEISTNIDETPEDVELVEEILSDNSPTFF